MWVWPSRSSEWSQCALLACFNSGFKKFPLSWLFSGKSAFFFHQLPTHCYCRPILKTCRKCLRNMKCYATTNGGVKSARHLVFVTIWTCSTFVLFYQMPIIYAEWKLWHNIIWLRLTKAKTIKLLFWRRQNWFLSVCVSVHTLSNKLWAHDVPQQSIRCVAFNYYIFI